MFNQMKMTTKLRFGFGLVLIVLMLVSSIAVFYALQIESEAKNVQNIRYVEITKVLRMLDISAAVHESVNAAAESENSDFLDKAESHRQKISTLVEEIQAVTGNQGIINDAVIDFVDFCQTNYNQGIKMAEFAIDQEFTDYIVAQKVYKAGLKDLDLKRTQVANMVNDQFNNSLGSITNNCQQMIQVSGGAAVVGFILSFIIATTIARNISTPLKKTVDMINKMSEGRLDTRLDMNRGDEIGDMAATMDALADSLQREVVANLKLLSEGDLRIECKVKNNEDIIRGSLVKMGNDLNQIMSQVRQVTDQIATEASTVSDSSHNLSQSAAQQSSSLEEISASMHELDAQTHQNAGHAESAKNITLKARTAAENGNSQMRELVTAMADINESSHNISKIIKVIDEIAFQTNLLALNAAVEAARAGQHGKGFAVVAEEVRNLAARSAKAARETADLIQGSVDRVEKGSDIAARTDTALSTIVDSISEVSNLIADIAESSNEQALGLSQINSGIERIDKATQLNTASAEESATSSQQLSEQAEKLREMLSQFKLRDQVFAVESTPSAGESSPMLGWD